MLKVCLRVYGGKQAIPGRNTQHRYIVMYRRQGKGGGKIRIGHDSGSGKRIGKLPLQMSLFKWSVQVCLFKWRVAFCNIGCFQMAAPVQMG